MIYYIGYYNCDEIRDEQRIVAPAAENKMKYIITALFQAFGESFEVVTPAQTKSYHFYKGKKLKIKEGMHLKTFSSFNSKYKLIRVMGHLLTRITFGCYLIIKVKREDHLLVYHSLAYKNIIRFIHKLKKCKLTIEVEELYSDVTENEKQRKKEIAYLQIADSYLFITELLRQEINNRKPAVLSHGTYQVVKDYGYRFDDEQIHVVYAGTFRKAKGGVYTAIAAAEYLDEHYTLEVLGLGSEEENIAVKKLIDEVSCKTKCIIEYVGFKSGHNFDSYIQACHIGLSTQQADAKFNGTSFPSKVLMYMANGLRVVSVRIPAVESSAVGDQIYYYDHQNAEEIAKVIRSVTFEDCYDSKKQVNKLHTAFVEQIKSLFD